MRRMQITQRHFEIKLSLSLVAMCSVIARGASAQSIPPGGTNDPPNLAPLTVHPTNPRYFADAQGNPVYLTGSHTWSNLQDEWTASYPAVFDFQAYLEFLQEHNHNFIRLWRWELPQYMYDGDLELRFSEPHPWKRISGQAPTISPAGGGGGTLNPGAGGFAPGGSAPSAGGIAPASPGKFDLTQFNPEYFDRLRERVELANEAGMYISIMLFEGHGLNNAKTGWFSHPFHSANNVNGINGDPNADGKGIETHTLAIAEVTALQEAYVMEVIDAVNDLDNVMFEIANESAPGSIEWQNHFIEFIQEYEQTLPKQHPVVFTTPFPGPSDAIWQSSAHAVSPVASAANGSYADDPPPADGVKVVISDSDHIFGCGGTADWVWKSFTRGLNVIYMDSYYEDTPFCPPPSDGVRLNLGYTLAYAKRMNLAEAMPLGELASTEFCIADVGASYLAYAPEGGPITLDLAGAAGELTVEWFNPSTGAATEAPAVQGGGSVTLTPPTSADSIVFVGGLPPGQDPLGPNAPSIFTTFESCDLNGDHLVDVDDVRDLVTNWGPCPASGSCIGDINGDGEVGIHDIIDMMEHWSG